MLLCWYWQIITNVEEQISFSKSSSGTMHVCKSNLPEEERESSLLHLNILMCMKWSSYVNLNAIEYDYNITDTTHTALSSWPCPSRV